MAVTEQSGSALAAKPDAAELIAKARELSPFLTAQAPHNEAKGALTDEVVAALRDNGFLKMWVPRVYGGLEVKPSDALQVIEALSYGDGSTGWVVMASQVSTGTGAAYLPPSAANTIFGGATLPLIAGQGSPIGKAEVVPGGFKLSGNWSYGSGIKHTTYLHNGGIVFENGKPRLIPGTNAPDMRIFVVPTSEAKILGNWDVLGLRATGSVDYTLTDVFVPEEFTHLQPTKMPRQGGHLYRLGIQGLAAIGHTGFALGLGRRILDELKALVGGSSAQPYVLSEAGRTDAFQERYATMEARLRAVRSLSIETWREIDDAIAEGREMNVRETTMARLTLNHTTSEAAEVCAFAYRFAGGHSLRNTPIQRCLRDMYAGTQHAIASPVVLRDAGRELLGFGKGQVWGFRGLVDPVTYPEDKRA